MINEAYAALIAADEARNAAYKMVGFALGTGDDAAIEAAYEAQAKAVAAANAASLAYTAAFLKERDEARTS